MRDFYMLCSLLPARLSFEYRIVFVKKGHPWTRHKRALQDTIRAIIKPYVGAECSIKLSELLDAVRVCSPSGTCSYEGLKSYVAQQHFKCDFQPALWALAEKNYIAFDCDTITLCDD